MKRTTALTVILLAAFIIAGCAKQPTGNAAQEQTIKIGTSLPLTGEAASYGLAAKAGMDVAAREINDAGGINGRKLVIIYEDDRCTSDGANTVAKLTGVDKVDVIIGPLCSASAGPAMPIAQASKTPTILAFSSAPGLTKAGDYIFRIYPSDALQGKYMAEQVYNRFGKRSIAIIYTQNTWGQGVHDVFVQRYKELGGTILIDEGFPQEARDFRTTVVKIKAENPDAVVAQLYPASSLVFFKQAKEAGLKQLIMGGDPWDTDEILKSGIANGVFFTEAVTQNPAEFNARVQQETGIETNFVTPLGYDAVKIYADVAGKAGTDKNAVRDELVRLNYTGVSNPVIAFDNDRELGSAVFTLKTIRNNASEDVQ
jgi:branched-chain amino acid transport system substrate-binding protein